MPVGVLMVVGLGIMFRNESDKRKRLTSSIGFLPVLMEMLHKVDYPGQLTEISIGNNAPQEEIQCQYFRDGFQLFVLKIYAKIN